MAYTTPDFSSYSFGEYNNGVFTPDDTGDRGRATLTNNDPSATGLKIGDSVTFTYDTGGSTEQGTFQGYYSDGTKEYPFFYNIDAGNYYTLGSLQPGQNYAITAANYDGGPVCFATGTLIRAASGEVAVEDLQVGDLVVTASGEHRPIRWIGTRALNLRNHPKPETVMPVRIRAHALGANKPARDLLVSPKHAVCLDLLGEVLIPAVALVNGATIVQEPVETVTYWHVELDSHDLLMAENLPAESYLDWNNRAFFIERGKIDPDASPDGDRPAPSHADFCRPFYESGALVEVVRTQLRQRNEALGWRLTQPETWADVHLEVDRRIVQPKTRDCVACFELPAGAQEVWLVASAGVPRHISDSTDARSLGLCLKSLQITDGLEAPRVVALDDPQLCDGFHAPGAGHRWTSGRARLPVSLLAGMTGNVFLQITVAGHRIARWVEPEGGAGAGEAEPSAEPAAGSKHLRLVEVAA